MSHGQGGFHGHNIPPGEEPRWLDHPENVRKLIQGFWGLCGLVVLFDAAGWAGLYHRHPHFGVDGYPAFYGIYGLVACVALVLAAKQLRKLVMRPEDYYE